MGQADSHGIILRITLVSYDGLKNVTDLPIYPLRFHRDADAFKAKMMERGRRFCKLLTERHWEYSGLCASEPQEQVRPLNCVFVLD